MPPRGYTSTQKGLPRPGAWITGPDPVRHKRYRRYKLAECQARHFAYDTQGRLVSPDQVWEVTFEQWEALIQSDPEGDSKYVCRRDRSLPWRIDNMVLLTRSEMSRRPKNHRRPHVPEGVRRYFKRHYQRQQEKKRLDQQPAAKL